MPELELSHNIEKYCTLQKDCAADYHRIGCESGKCRGGCRYAKALCGLRISDKKVFFIQDSFITSIYYSHYPAFHYCTDCLNHPRTQMELLALMR